MAEIEIPQYFICPISLQIMKDPVTTMLGITYDRESIEKWLSTAKDHSLTCPVTKQPLPKHSDLTPNHTLRRLIQAWCSDNATNGVDRIPTPKSPLEKFHVLKLVRDLELPHHNLYQHALMKMETLAMENERNRSVMAEAGVARVMISFITWSFKQGTTTSTYLEKALRILRLVWSTSSSTSNIRPLVIENLEFISTLTWVLQQHGHDDHKVVIVNEAMPVLKTTIHAASSSLLSCLKLEFFKEIVAVLRNHKVISKQAIKSALQVLTETCPVGSNRIKIVEAGAVFELVEIELEKPEKNITELAFELLAHLCNCADGREQLLQHAGSIAVISKRILRVSPATSDRAVHILSLIAKFYGSKEVVSEMLRVGAVTKLCMVMQAACEAYLKEKARGILRLHSIAWNNSPCISIYLLTRYQR
ncbi:RING-type E3 ubiquitin transferase [Quillaja saponaria]|uniref:U-box domain-containing protein n=1 Tax=Quillaja saponaria TaxID=32244 RepID=A0AAD7KY24_QUISA|nr:RING-type E3 ubiquitin transferase [Quillaja saponaria]